MTHTKSREGGVEVIKQQHKKKGNNKEETTRWWWWWWPTREFIRTAAISQLDCACMQSVGLPQFRLRDSTLNAAAARVLCTAKNKDEEEHQQSGFFIFYVFLLSHRTTRPSAANKMRWDLCEYELKSKTLSNFFGDVGSQAYSAYKRNTSKYVFTAFFSSFFYLSRSS